MKLSSLANLIAGTIPAPAFIAGISHELQTHVSALRTKGASAPVVVVEDVDLVLDRPSLNTLLRLFAQGHLSATELAYVADAMLLSDHVTFPEPAVADYLAECTDAEINGTFSIARALAIVGGGRAA